MVVAWVPVKGAEGVCARGWVGSVVIELWSGTRVREVVTGCGVLREMVSTEVLGR